MEKNFKLYTLNDTRLNLTARYVGITCHPMNARFSRHVYDSKNPTITTRKANWMRKMIRDGVVIEPIVLMDGLSEKQVKEIEMHFIKYFNPGGILTNGTTGGDGWLPNEETRKKLSLAQMGNQKAKGKKKSEETRRKMSKVKSEAHRLSISEAGTKAWNRPPIVQYDKNGIFIAEHQTCEEASMKSGVSKTGIRNVCNGYRNWLKGFIFKYKTLD